MRPQQQPKQNHTCFRTTLNAKQSVIQPNNAKRIKSREKSSQQKVNNQNQIKYQNYFDDEKNWKLNKKSNKVYQRTHHLQHEDQTSNVHETKGGGILISVNIQDLINPKKTQVFHDFEFKKQQLTPKKQQNTPKIQKALNANNWYSSKMPNKVTATKKNVQDPIDFQCKQQINYTKWASPGPKQRFKYKQNLQLKKEAKNIKPQQKPKQLIQIPPALQRQMLESFQSRIEQINSNNNSESMVYLDKIYQIYKINPNYIQQCQKNFNRKMRAYVVEWMMQVSEQFQLRRQTFHISVNLFDRVLQRQKNVAKNVFQVYAAASIFIASKLQQIKPRECTEFSRSTQYSMSEARLKEAEVKICQILKYRFNPPTLYRWANRLMVQWDSYIKIHSEVHPFFVQRSPIHFKQPDIESYINFRLIMQLIDCSILDIETYQYSPKLVVCSFMYLYLNKAYKIYTRQQIASTFPQSSLYLFDEDNLLNQLFSQFLQFTFGFVLHDLLPTIQYCATYFILPESVKAPKNTENVQLDQDMDLEWYESFQTYNENMYRVVVKRIQNKENQFVKKN